MLPCFSKSPDSLLSPVAPCTPATPQRVLLYDLEEDEEAEEGGEESGDELADAVEGRDMDSDAFESPLSR